MNNQKYVLDQLPGKSALLAELFENTEIGYLYFKPDGEIKAVNNSARKFLGRENQPLIGEFVQNSDHFKDLNDLHNYTSIVATVCSGGKPYTGERLIHKKDGSRSIIKVKTVGIQEKGSIQGLLLILWDITEPRKLERIIGDPLINLEKQASENPSQLRQVLNNLVNLTVDKEQQIRVIEEENRKLRQSLTDLQQEFDDAKATLKVILQQQDDSNRELKNSLLGNLKERVFPYVQKIRMTSEEAKTKAYIEIIASKLEEIFSPLSSLKSDRQFDFSATEMKVIDLIQQGKSTKEIAHLLDLAVSTIKSHRLNIRKKMGIGRKKISLRKQLMDHKSV